MAPTDGLLVRDINGNGVIDDGTELFGTSTILPNGTKAANGFAALAALDSNGDGKIDASDPVYAQLAVWRDLNGDGKTDPGELQSLAQAGVASLRTSGSPNNATMASGATDWLDGTFTKSDGTTGVMSDILFQRNPSDTVALTTVDVPDDIVALPDIAGMGNVASLHQAMAQDQTGALAALVAGFADADTWATERALAEQILIQWAGAQNVAARYGSNFSTAPTVDGRAVRAMEVFFGESITVKTGSAGQFENVWEGLVDNAAAILVAQTSASGLLSLVTQDETTGAWDFSVVSQLYASWLQVDPKPCCESLTGFLRAAQLTGAMTQADIGAMKAAVIGTSSLAWMVFANSGVRMLTEAQAQANFSGATVFAEGGDVGETLSSLRASTSFRGGNGNDTIDCTGDGQWISGGAGDDTLTNVYGYVYGAGDGHDTVTLAGNGKSQVVLVGVTEAQLRADGVLTQQGTDLVLTLSPADSVVFKNWFTYGAYDFQSARLWAGSFILDNAGGQTTFAMSDIDAIGSTVWGTDGADAINVLRSFSTTAHGGAGNDTITGSYCADKLYGDDGNDYIDGYAGADYIDGGAGNDTINGGSAGGGGATALGGTGDDTIYNCTNVIFRPGDGHDSVTMVTGGVLTLQGFATGVLEGANVVQQQDADLVINLGQDSVRLVGWFSQLGTAYYTLHGVGSTVRVVDGAGNVATYTHDQMTAMSSIIVGTDAADAIGVRIDAPSTIYGNGGNDALTGSWYNDTLYGGDGDDVLNGNGGNDTLDGGAGNDTITGGPFSGSGTTAIGGLGDDTISGCANVLFHLGDGHDSITMVTGGVLTLQGFAAGVLEGANVVQQQDTDLVINLGADSVRLVGWFQQLGTGYETRQGIGATVKVVDAAGNVTVYTRDQIIALAETIVGTDAADTIGVRCDAPSTIYGNAGNDTISGSWCADKIYGGDGNDVINGNGGADLLDGGAGNDTITGSYFSGYSATAIGGLGDDTISGCLNVVFRPGDGHDTVTMVAGGVLTLQGFAADVLMHAGVATTSGQDVVLKLGADKITLKNWFTSSNGGRVNAGTIVATAADGTTATYSTAIMDKLATTIQGTSGNDVIVADQTLPATINGGAGNDTITGSPFDDILTGGGGADNLYGGAGNDTLNGGGSGTLDGGDGYDVAFVIAETVSNCEMVQATGLCNAHLTVTMTQGGTFDLSMLPRQSITFMPSGPDLVLQLAGTGAYGTVVIPGNVTLKNWFTLGSDGVSRPFAGNIQFGDAFGWATVLSSAAVDALASNVVGTSAADYLAAGSIIATTVHAGAGDDQVIGSVFDDSLYGEAGNDTIVGGDGNDIIDGGDGNDTIYGDQHSSYSIGTGNDTIFGGAGNDTIYAGGGFDVVSGGVGDDAISCAEVVIYNYGDGKDTVTFDANTPNPELRLVGYDPIPSTFSFVSRPNGAPDLRINIPGGGSVTLKGYFSVAAAKQVKVTFYDDETGALLGTWTPSALASYITRYVGFGFAGDEAAITSTLRGENNGVLASSAGESESALPSAISAVSSLATGEQAQAGAGAVLLNGGHQAGADVTWCLADVAHDASGLFSTQAGADVEALIKGACAAWERVSGLHFTEVADDGTASLRIGFGAFDSAVTGVIGYTTATTTDDGSFAKGAIVRIEDTSETAVARDASGELVYSAVDASVEQVLEHEIGHALGLASDADPSSVMCWKLTGQNRTLDATDVAGAQALYGTPAQAAADPRADAAALTELLGGEIGVPSVLAAQLAAQDDALGVSGAIITPSSGASANLDPGIQSAANLLTQVLAQTSMPAAQITPSQQGIQQDNVLLLAVSKAA